MNSFGKWKLTGFILAAIGLLAFIYFLMVGGEKPGSQAILLAVLLIAFVLMIIVYFKRSLEKKNLSGKYLDAYDEIARRIGTSNLSMLDKREAGRQAMEILVEASHGSQDVPSVIGDPARFADDMISAYGGMRSVLSLLIRGLQFLLIYALFIQGATYFMDKSEGMASFFTTQTLVMSYVTYGIIALVALPLFNIGSGKKRPGVYYMIALAVIIGVTAAFILGGNSVLKPLYTEVVVFAGPVSILIWAVAMAILQLIYRRTRKVQ